MNTDWSGQVVGTLVGVIAAVGALTGVASKIVANVVTGEKWHKGLLGAAGGGAIEPFAVPIVGFAGSKYVSAATESTVNQTFSYIPGLSWANGENERKKVNFSNLGNSIKTVAQDTAINGTMSLAFGWVSNKLIKVNSGWKPPKYLYSSLFGKYGRRIHGQTIITNVFMSVSNVTFSNSDTPSDENIENINKQNDDLFNVPNIFLYRNN